MTKDKNTFWKFILTIILALVLSVTLSHYKVTSAAENSAEIKFSINGGAGGEVKAGSNIEITVDLSNLTNFYAGSVDYTYDNTLLEVSSIVVDPKFKEHKIYEAYNDVAKNGNVARYAFSIMGEDVGISGTTRFITIKGKAKRNGNLSINQENVEYQLVQKINGEMKEIGNTIFNNGKEKYNIISGNSGGGASPEKKVELITSSEPAVPDDKSTETVSSEAKSNETSGNVTNNNETSKTNEDNQENKEGTAEGSDKLEKSFDGSSSENNDVDSLENVSDKNSNSGSSILYFCLALVGGIIVAITMFLVYKKRKK